MDIWCISCEPTQNIFYSHVPIKLIDMLNCLNFPQTDTDIDVKTALIGVKTGPNKRICLEKINISIRLLGTLEYMHI